MRRFELKSVGGWLTLVFFSLLLMCVSCGPGQEELKISALDHFNRGNAYYRQSRMLAAADEYKKAIAMDPEQERFYYNLGLVYYSLVLYNKAIEAYWKAIEQNPQFPEVWYNLALAFEKVDKTDDAFMAYEKYQRLNTAQKKQRPKPITPKVLNKPKG
jgi:tetratricopeptide (TPR) repeat protein